MKKDKNIRKRRTAVSQNTIVRDLRRNYSIYILLIPIILFYLVFMYKPMYGLIIAFKDYSPAKGILGSDWVGFRFFKDFFTNPYFWRLIKNTLTISINSIIFSFPAPILLALLMNELKGKVFPRTVQLIAYLPHFISTVVICGLIEKFTSENGFIVQMMSMLFGFEPTTLLNYPQYFVPTYIISGIWQGAGWGSIVYLAALTGIDQSLYEAAAVDGAGRLRQTWHITLPGILPTIITMLILQLGKVMSVGYEKIILLYRPITYETADVISTYSYRLGLLEGNWSFSTAVGLFNSVVNFILVIASNRLSKKVTGLGLW
ncbi:MAG: sugar ABC transporter permease [Clostridia bacterium]|nr:sugar ABC transporter permease [Clostridia bacterium]